MIEAIGLSKFYGDFAAVRDVTFSVPRGQVCAFLGPNGAGKSTTMKLLTGYLAASAGTARIAGFDVYENRLDAARHLGYLAENGPLYSEMTPLSLLKFFGRARGMSGGHLSERIDAVVRQCFLNEVLEKSISKLSKGYRQRDMERCHRQQQVLLEQNIGRNQDQQRQSEPDAKTSRRVQAQV